MEFASPDHQGKASSYRADDSYLNKCVEVWSNELSLKSFLVAWSAWMICLIRFERLCRGGMHEGEAVLDLMLSPAFRTGKFPTLASALCTTEAEVRLLSQEDGSITVETASCESTLQLELTIILLCGQLKIDFVVDGEVRSTAIHFNTVMKGEYFKKYCRTF
jgi:hypothetical protein